MLREALQFGQTQPRKCSLRIEQFWLFCFLKTRWTFVAWWGRVGRKSEGLLPPSSPPSPHHDPHHYGATPLFDKVLGDACMDKWSSIFMFWRDLPKFEEILKANFLPPHNDQYVKQPIRSIEVAVCAWKLYRAHVIGLTHFFPLLSFHAAHAFPRLETIRCWSFLFSFSLSFQLCSLWGMGSREGLTLLCCVIFFFLVAFWGELCT